MSKQIAKRLLSIPLCCSTLLCFNTSANELNLYGLGHLSIDSVDDGIDSSVYTASNSSRLGINGFYELSPELKLIFQYETGVDLTAQGENDGNGGASSSGQLFTKGRPSYLGLEGKAGKILIGHMPFLDQYVNDYNLFADQVGDLGNLWEASGIPGRTDNSIYYQTPKFSGFHFSSTYVPEEGDNNADLWLFKGKYQVQDFNFAVSYTQVGQGQLSNDDLTGIAVVADYQFSHISVGIGFQQELDIGGVAGNDRDSFTFGISINTGEKSKIKLQLANSSGDTADSDAQLFAIGYDYQLAESTLLYVAYAQMDNDDNVNFSVNGKGHGDRVIPLMGEDPNALSLGIVYQFNHKLLE